MQKIDSIVPQIIFHYTNFEKFKCIVQFGTLRFKLSIQSNDLLDTKYIVELIKRIDYFTDDQDASKKRLLEFLLGYYKRADYQSTFKAYAACFTGIADSRLLWDAYTVNRPFGGKLEKIGYNGVCIAFKSDMLRKLLYESEAEKICNSGMLAPVFYKEQEQIIALDFLIKRAVDIFDAVKDDPDQSQDFVPTIKTGYQLDFGGIRSEPHLFEIKLKRSIVETLGSFIESIDKTAPFFKHGFWSEENEYRAVLHRHIAIPNTGGIVKGDIDNEYIDLPISKDFIDYVILGPCFSENDTKVLNEIKDFKLEFSNLEKKYSHGTGIITIR